MLVAGAQLRVGYVVCCADLRDDILQRSLRKSLERGDRKLVQERIVAEHAALEWMRIQCLEFRADALLDKSLVQRARTILFVSSAITESLNR